MTGTKATCRDGQCFPTTTAEVVAHVAQHRVAGGARALARLVFALNQPVGGAAAFLTFQRWFEKVCSPFTPNRLPAELVGAFCRASQNTEVIEFIARDYGGVFVPVPAVSAEHHDILQAQLRVVREIGDQASSLAAMLDDGRVDTHEVREFDRQSDEAITALVAMKSVVRAALQVAV